jgi:hypothetical protein
MVYALAIHKAKDKTSRKNSAKMALGTLPSIPSKLLDLRSRPKMINTIASTLKSQKRRGLSKI